MSERRRNRQKKERSQEEGDHHDSENDLMIIDDSDHEERNHQIANAGNNNIESDPFQAFMEATDAVDESGNYRQRTRSASSTDLMLMGEETMHALEMEAGEEIAIANEILNQAQEQVTTAGAARTQQQAASSSSVSRSERQQSLAKSRKARSARKRNDLEHRSPSITTTPIDAEPQRQIKTDSSKNKRKRKHTQAVPKPRSSKSSSTRKVCDRLPFVPYTITVTPLDPPQGGQSSSTNPGQQKATSSQVPHFFQHPPSVQRQTFQATNRFVGTPLHHYHVPLIHPFQPINQASQLDHPYYPYIPPIFRPPPPPNHVPAVLMKPPFDPPHHLMPMDEQWKMYHHLQIKQMESQFQQELYQSRKDLYERHHKLRRELLWQQQQERQQSSNPQSEESPDLSKQSDSNQKQQDRDVSNSVGTSPAHSSQVLQEGPRDLPGQEDQMEVDVQNKGNPQDKSNDEVPE
ncbi:hypothetical protein CAEBREN_13770 [Caenorhabditis brenneri]|uniref:Uncharacterized protein n=1 Tax=Caenorhabditis brenneri TaxID=135651 RepID=G0M7D0_CAEBE|nr:hypothetical protein CAEBREN_13770 [Caenorhabditis brenneri]